MRKVFNYAQEIYRVYQPSFSSNKKDAPVIAEIKLSAEPEKKELDFLQMLNAEIQALR